MDYLDKFLNLISYKFPKGYPNVSDPKEKKLLLELVDSFIKEEKEKKTKSSHSKKDIIDLINDLEDDDDNLEKIYNFISNLSSSPIIDEYLKDKNLTDKDIHHFMSLLQRKNKVSDFVSLINDKIKLDLSKDNFFDQIPGFTKEELKEIYLDMKDSIKGTVSLGPGENFLSLFFSNVSKRNSKGDLDIDGKEVELKSRSGFSGAILAPKEYHRGAFTNSVKPHIDSFINKLPLEPEQKEELKIFNVAGKFGGWPKKLDYITQKYIELGGDSNKYIKGLNDMFKELYSSLDLEASKYVTKQGFNSYSFTIDLAKQLSKQYYEEEKFDGLMVASPNGDFKYYSESKFLEDLGDNLKVDYPSDLLPRIKI